MDIFKGLIFSHQSIRMSAICVSTCSMGKRIRDVTGQFLCKHLMNYTCGLLVYVKRHKFMPIVGVNF